MYRFLILFIITLIFIVNNRRVDEKTGSFINISKLCQFYPKAKINNHVTFVCPESYTPNKNKKVDIPIKNELLVNFDKYYTYDKNNKLIDKAFLSNTFNANSSTLSICNQPGSNNCKTLNLYLVSPKDPNKINIDQSSSLNSQKESSLVYDIDLINKNIIEKEYDPYKNVFQVTLNKDNKDDRDIILKLNNKNNLVYELNGVRLNDVKIHSLELLNNKNRLDDKNRRDFVLISHNTLSNKKSFLIIKLRYISLKEIDKNKLLIKITSNLFQESEQKVNLTSTDAKTNTDINELEKNNVEIEIMGEDEGTERVIEMLENKMLLELSAYNDNEIYVNNVKIQSGDYKFLVIDLSIYNIKYKNKIHKLVFRKSEDFKQKTYKLIGVMWICTFINAFYSLYKFYFESLNYINFLTLFSNYLNGMGVESVGTYVGKLMKYLLIYIDDKTGFLNIDISKSLILLTLLQVISCIIIFLYFIYLLISKSKNKNITKKMKKLQKYKMNLLILLNYIMLPMLIIYIKLYNKVKFIYVRGIRISSFSFNLLNSVIFLTIILTIYDLYPKSLKNENTKKSNKKFKLTDIIKDEYHSTISTSYSVEKGYKQKLITKPIVQKDRNVIIIDNKYQILYINSIISETIVVVCFYLTSSKTNKETGIFLIKFLYWFLISIYIQRYSEHYDQDKFNRYLMIKSLRYLAITSLIIIQIYIKKEFMAYLIIIYVNHCINHKIVYNIIKLVKKYKYVVTS